MIFVLSYIFLQMWYHCKAKNVFFQNKKKSLGYLHVKQKKKVMVQ